MDPPNISVQHSKKCLLLEASPMERLKSSSHKALATKSHPKTLSSISTKNLIKSFSKALIQKNLFIFILCWSMLISTGYCGILKPSCRLVGHEELIDVAGCDLVVVKVNKCRGYCTSFSFFHPINNDKLTVHAKCCRMTEVKHVEVAVSCNDGDRTVKIPSAVECNCYDCNADTI